MATLAQMFDRVLTATQTDKLQWTRQSDGSWQAFVVRGAHEFRLVASTQGGSVRRRVDDTVVVTLPTGAQLTQLLNAIEAKTSGQGAIDTVFDALA